MRDYFQCILQTGHYLHAQKHLLLVLKILSCVFGIKLFFQVFVPFASMSQNPDTGIKDPHFSLKLQNSEPLKYPSLGHKRKKNKTLRKAETSNQRTKIISPIMPANQRVHCIYFIYFHKAIFILSKLMTPVLLASLPNLKIFCISSLMLILESAISFGEKNPQVHLTIKRE